MSTGCTLQDHSDSYADPSQLGYLDIDLEYVIPSGYIQLKQSISLVDLAQRVCSVDSVKFVVLMGCSQQDCSVLYADPSQCGCPDGCLKYRSATGYSQQDHI